MRRRPYVLASVTWLYIAWSLVPLLIAIQFSFNDGRSRSSWQGFSTRWYVGTPEAAESVLYDPTMRAALNQSLKLAILTMLVAAPLGVALAVGLARWRGVLGARSTAAALRDGRRTAAGDARHPPGRCATGRPAPHADAARGDRGRQQLPRDRTAHHGSRAAACGPRRHHIRNFARTSRGLSGSVSPGAKEAPIHLGQGGRQ